MNVSLDVTKYLESEVNKIFFKIGNQLADELEARLPAASKNYVRTGDVIASLRNPPKIKVKDSRIKTSILNLKLIRPSRSSANYMFNHHMNWNGDTTWKGMYVPALVPYWLDAGFTVVGQGGSRHKWEGLNYINGALHMSVSEYANNLMEESMIKFMKILDVLNK